MGRRSVRGPIGFMPSDGKFLGAKDLQGLPSGPDAERMQIYIVDISEYDEGELVNGKRMKAFWSILFDRPVNSWLLEPWPKTRPEPGNLWCRSKKEWKIGPEVATRIGFRFGMVLEDWIGHNLPIRMEQTWFGRDPVWGVRPVPMDWEADKEKVQKAMARIARGDWSPPVKQVRERPIADADKNDPPAGESRERQPGDDDEGCPACGWADGHEQECPEAPVDREGHDQQTNE